MKMALFKSFFARQMLSTHQAVLSTIRTQSSNLKPDPDAPVEMENPFKKELKQCILCKLNIDPDYKNYRLLSQFQSPYTGRIYPRHITGLCKRKQMQVEQEITKAQDFAYMPYTYKHKIFLKDPKLFDPENPVRSHRF
ncbi:mitochondrial 28S ribosomal protein S18c [Bombyx mori]|uniref:Mitochondrial 28S ribosomal protein S18c n=1 Tax=Bombyx mori TaxID=7091 RepID=A4GUC7_BOMMO|nr:mitochondrial 28S ribosomal protein S18c [Bombyx mori]ABO31093.1 mitochondrial 28S ribosomal protein S18c [Bombyx mori]